jgi:hypothetical protein
VPVTSLVPGSTVMVQYSQLQYAGPKTATVLTVLLITVEAVVAVSVVLATTAVEYELDVKTPVDVRIEVKVVAV